ncbi:hypothetical protein N431DRAFT_548338 [Stipitochalara longipes BDJ]|nr:hypothetical protein N431DRAFT_548338 [Stipitochalara longipes BDJ]
MASILRLCSIVLVLSLASFLPQFHRIWSRRDTSGISLNYVLFNSIIFTEHYAIGLHSIVNRTGVESNIPGTAPTADDLLDLCQHCVVWGSSLILFTMCLYFPPHHRGPRYTVLTIHALFTILSLIPVVVECYLPIQDSALYLDQQQLGTFLTTLHRSFIGPIITVLGLASLFPQARETLSRSSPGALSIRGLAAQATVFMLVALYWPFRIGTPPGVWPPRSWGSLVSWYQLAGWATLDNAIFGTVQMILLWIAIRRNSRVQEKATNGEMAPLLQV